ncbi:hydrogenase maturation protease [Thiocystis violacea]|uniref:hydrogenase maturation protease n=1 Tax=Thiocystis violacea TaxID=13725 RepID=UPI001908B5D1|nr:hydrogenase maturation protease [Thiocystis violacea]MBK1718014.1 hydrogenase maturation protease [Thiocystis violacea]
MKTLIIGYGSPIRGDDALGPLAADRLENRSLPTGVEVISRHILTAELVADIADKDRVIFLDAAADSAPGTVRCRRLEPDARAVSTMAHFLDPRELLAWCETLYGRVPETCLVTAAGDSFDYDNYRLTPIAEAALDRMLDWVDRLMTQEGWTALSADGHP